MNCRSWCIRLSVVVRPVFSSVVVPIRLSSPSGYICCSVPLITGNNSDFNEDGSVERPQFLCTSELFISRNNWPAEQRNRDMTHSPYMRMCLLMDTRFRHVARSPARITLMCGVEGALGRVKLLFLSRVQVALR
jgi:hypothetical protein